MKEEDEDLADLALYLGTALVGYFVGVFVRDKKDKLGWTGKLSTFAIIVMVSSMGMRMGANDEVIRNLGSIGFYALFITLVILSFSVGFTSLTRRVLGLDNKGYLKGKTLDIPDEVEVSVEEQEVVAEKQEGKIDKMIIMVVLAVLCGGIVGYLISEHLISDVAAFDTTMGYIITVGLCVLLFLVGLDMGIEGTVISQIKEVGARVLVIPFAVIIGSLIGAFVCGLILPLSIKEALAVGSGMGWYSLAPGIIIDKGFVVASAVSFLHNVMREVLSFVFIPIVAKKVGYVETVALPGAAAMDVCLPIVERQTRSDIAVFSFISGLVLSFVVPILVPLVLSF